MNSYVVPADDLQLSLTNRKEPKTMISFDWVLVYDLASILGGIILGALLVVPRRYSGRYDRRSDY